MNIEKQLINEHSHASTLSIVNYIGNNNTRFKELMTVFLCGDYRLTQRAAWALSNAVIEHPQLIKPYLGKLISMLAETHHHPAVARNILRLLQEIEIPEKHHGELIDVCFKCIINQAQPLAIRAFAITVATKICKLYPELKNELQLILNELAQFSQAPAIKVRVRNAHKMLSD
ncbi:MAG: hypothetical protein KF900_08830 [Bacteroidetes bacterium]|nr:hypothetical protein [Bacteroidota bacterium]